MPAPAGAGTQLHGLRVGFLGIAFRAIHGEDQVAAQAVQWRLPGHLMEALELLQAGINGGQSFLTAARFEQCFTDDKSIPAEIDGPSPL
ncbi:MAG: hypothetical protein ACE5ID_00060 [Acidobacteriota bacterium]